MDAATRDRLVREGRTRWFCIRIVTGRRFAEHRWCWARDEDDARQQIMPLLPHITIVSITEEHR